MFTEENAEGFVYMAWEDADMCSDCIARINGCDLQVSECDRAKYFARTMKGFCLGQTTRINRYR
ncbi:hypothetical protein ACFLVP_02880 [Chloroflexota bacterium]